VLEAVSFHLSLTGINKNNFGLKLSISKITHLGDKCILQFHYLLLKLP